MKVILENLDIFLSCLSLGIAGLIAAYFYSATHPPKSIFQKPTNHVEIRSWKIKRTIS